MSKKQHPCVCGHSYVYHSEDNVKCAKCPHGLCDWYDEEEEYEDEHRD